MEPAEGLRFAGYLSPKGTAIINTNVVPAASSYYPPVANLVNALKDTCERVIAYDATRLALDAGHPQTLNVLLLGTLSRMLPLSTLEDVLPNTCPKKLLPPISGRSSLDSESSTRNSVIVHTIHSILASTVGLEPIISVTLYFRVSAER